MLSKTFGLIFYLKKTRNYVKGPVPIYLRITVDGKRTEIATKRVCDDPQKWSSSSGRISGTKESVKVVNAHLDTLQAQVFDACKQLLQKGEEIMAEKLKNHLTGVRERPRMILEIFEQHNEQIKALVGNGYAPLTYKRYGTALAHTREFIRWKFGVYDLEVSKLNYAFISDYEFYLRSVRRCAHNSTMKYLSNFKKVVLQCVKKGWPINLAGVISSWCFHLRSVVRPKPLSGKR